MSDILHEESVLVLNNIKMRLGWTSPATAFAMLMGGARDTAPAKAVNIHYQYDEYGKPITDQMEWFEDVEWSDWLTLEPRRGDLDKVVHTSKRIIRIPTIIVATHFSKMPMKEQRATAKNIRRRDKNRCQYTGVQLTNSTFSLDHIIPKSKGGKDSWLNLVSCHKDVNSRKGSLSNKEAGLKLLNQPIAPRSLPLCALCPEIKHPDHAHF